MILPPKIPVRKCCRLVAPSIVIVITGLWYFSILYLKFQATALTFQLENIALQSKSTRSESSFLTRRLSDVSQSWSDSRILLRDVLNRVSKERKLIIWGIEEDEEDGDENNLIELLADLYDVTIDPSDVDAVKRVGVYRGHVPRPLLIYVTNSHVKDVMLGAIANKKEHPLDAHDWPIQRLERFDESQQACSMHIKSVGKFQLLRHTEEKVGAILTDALSPNEDDKPNNRTKERFWIAHKPYGNRILLEYDRATYFLNTSQPIANYTLPYPWGGTSHVVLGGYFFYVRAKSNFIVKYDLENRRMVRYRQIKGAKYTEKDKNDANCAFSHIKYSDISLHIDEFGLWATYCTSKGDMKLSLLDPDSLKIVKQYDTGWRKSWFEAIFVACGVAYAVRRFQTAPFLQIKYTYNTIREESSHPLDDVTVDLHGKNQGQIMHLNYDRIEKRLTVWTSFGAIGWLNVEFKYASVPK